MYCPVDMMDSPAGLCAAGYYCTINSTTDRPSGVGGDKCSPGHYCLEGSWAEDPCPPGHYLPSTGAKNITYCLLCTAGKFCNSSGLDQPEGDCNAGYYCPEGQTVANPNAYPCPAGYYCEVGSAAPQLCPSGTYQDEMMSWDCKECPPGFYCDNALAPIVNYTMYECPEGKGTREKKKTKKWEPARNSRETCQPLSLYSPEATFPSFFTGHYCQNGTISATQFACPAGTFNNMTGLTSDIECLPCIGESIF